MPDFPTLDYSGVDYKSLASDEEIALPVKVDKADLIIMTQACDIHNGKVKNITLCRIYPLNEYLVEAGLAPKKPLDSRAKVRSLIGDLGSDRVGNMYLLDQPGSNPYGGVFEDFLVVKFDESINYPLGLIEQRILSEEGEMMKLLPPYREALSQAYATFFMRVGNPIDRGDIHFEVYADFLKLDS